MSDSSIVIIQGTVGLYTVATRCHRCFAVTLKYTEDSSLKILPHSLTTVYSLVQYYRAVIHPVPVQSHRFLSIVNEEACCSFNKFCFPCKFYMVI